MLKLSDLAGQPDFQLGPLEISPSRRLIEGPAGKTHLEPLIMQALLMLVDGKDSVVTREALFKQCWGAAAVGDDSLNRAVANIRRALEQVAPGQIKIETIPRTGYRLTGIDSSGPAADSDFPDAASDVPGRISRRKLLYASAAVAACTAGVFLMDRSSNVRRFDELMDRGDEAFRDGSALPRLNPVANGNEKMVRLYEEAVQVNPGSARAWGLLAYFRAGGARRDIPQESAQQIAAAQLAIRRALEIDPREPNALVGRYLLEGRMLDWIGRDRALRSILKSEPRNLPAMIELMPVLQAAGLTRESWIWNERILQAAPLAPVYLVVRAMKLWILGRVADSDNVIDRVRGLWPNYGFAFEVRFNLFALTGRPSAALALLNSAPEKLGSPAEVDVWRAALEALETRTRPAIDEARTACLSAARKVPSLVNDIVMILGALELVDEAFEVTDGFILWRGKIVSEEQADGRASDDYNRRMTQWLFTPPLAGMRADPRFARLCDEFGLTAYWRSRNIQPDYLAYP